MRKQLFPFALMLFMLPAFFLVGYNFGAGNQRALTERAVKAAEDTKVVADRWEALYRKAVDLCGR